ncbi:MAG: hypothetical protein AAGA25_07570 [Planctomycetota bacterium]
MSQLAHLSPGPTADYTDADLTFFMQVHRDVRQANWALSHLRTHFPGARLLLVSDNDNDPRWPGVANRFGGAYFAGEYLYGTESGGLIIQRMLDRYMLSPTPYLFKLDTDTKTNRRFQTLPTGRCVFGTLEYETFAKRIPLKGLPSVQGGFVGYTRQAAEDIWRSGVLRSEALVKDYAGTYADTPEIAARADEGMVSTDFLVRYACKKLAIECRDYGEVRSLYRGWVATRTPDEFAFTHPHKEHAGWHPALHWLRSALPLSWRKRGARYRAALRKLGGS